MRLDGTKHAQTLPGNRPLIKLFFARSDIRRVHDLSIIFEWFVDDAEAARAEEQNLDSFIIDAKFQDDVGKIPTGVGRNEPLGTSPRK